MAFQIGDFTEQTNHGILHGIQREIACECWFTSQGRSIPKLIKIMDENGTLYTIRDIELITAENKNYSGIQTVEHLCRINIGGREAIVKLIYTKKNCRWSIVEI